MEPPPLQEDNLPRHRGQIRDRSLVGIAGAGVGIYPTPLAGPGNGIPGGDAGHDGANEAPCPRPGLPGEWWVAWGPEGVRDAV